MGIEVGKTPMPYKTVQSSTKICARCGAKMLMKVPAPLPGQSKELRGHQAKIYCPRGCNAGYKDRL